MTTPGAYTITLDLHRSTWHYFTTNPQGGGSGSNHEGSKRMALLKARRTLPPGEPHTVITKHAGVITQVETYDARQEER